MDDKELIRRIMEEVKDEKLREELLALVVEKKTKESEIKREEEEPINYLARQEILGGATEGVAKVGWWISLGISIVFILVGGFFSFILLFGLLGYLLLPAEERPETPDLTIGVLLSSLLVIGIAWFFTLRSGRKEYEKFKRKSVN